jgi:hypothetical protein
MFYTLLEGGAGAGCVYIALSSSTTLRSHSIQPDWICVHLERIQHAEKAEMRAVIPPTLEAIHMIMKLDNTAFIAFIHQ